MSEGSGEGDAPQQQRPIRDMQALLRFCIQGTVPEDGGASAQPMDPQRRAWLESALQTLSVDVVQEMISTLEKIKTKLAQLGHSQSHEASSYMEACEGEDSALDSILNSLDNLMFRVADLDIASDFYKIGGYEIVEPLLNSPHSSLKAKGAQLLAELVQNHEYCQRAALEMNFLPLLVGVLRAEEESDKTKAAVLYALSSLIRHNAGAQLLFQEECDGYSVLVSLMQQGGSEGALKLRSKVAFLLSSIMIEGEEEEGGSTRVKEALHSMGFMEGCVSLLKGEHDSSHEQVLCALLTFVRQFPPAVEQCAAGQFGGLKKLLEDRLELLGSKPEHLEEVSYATQLLAISFPATPTEGGGESKEPDTDR